MHLQSNMKRADWSAALSMSAHLSYQHRLKKRKSKLARIETTFANSNTIVLSREVGAAQAAKVYVCAQSSEQQ